MTPAGVFAGVCLLLAVYCAVDPFKHSAMSEFPDFEAVRVEVPPWSAIPVEKDPENLLQKSEIKFLNQVQGPESMAFDPAGRGPYTGVADGGLFSGTARSGLTSLTLRLIVTKRFAIISGNLLLREIVPST
ncbi:UNVERIFIED_CONTAM: protein STRICTOSIDINE SYNTHASE-LIKE 3 [Sesamum calycinum]|uniref:Protein STRICTOSIDINE SYNTHASE-LIKE 3 n=1 Tax=Sesamum calycinum TaxID=2727403 RepID=A0AAW2SBN8_9LAMI